MTSLIFKLEKLMEVSGSREHALTYTALYTMSYRFPDWCHKHAYIHLYVPV